MLVGDIENRGRDCNNINGKTARGLKEGLAEVMQLQISFWR